MARDSTGRDATGEAAGGARAVAEADATLRTWAVLAALLGSLVGVPALVLAEIEVGLLTGVGLPAALGVSRQTLLGVLALVPGFALGGLSLVVMTGWE